MILVNKGNFLVHTIMKNHDSVSKPKSTFYADFKVCLALEGDAVWEIEERSHHIRPGDIVLLDLGQKRHFTFFGEAGFKLCAFTLRRDAFQGQHHFLFFREQIKRQGNLLRNEALAELLKEAYEEWVSGRSLRYELISAKLTEFFIKAERCTGYTLRPMPEEQGRMLEILDYIDANITGGIRLETVAQKFGFTEWDLSRRFSAANGISFKQYVVEKKLQRAIHLLQTTDGKMIDIALDSGFDSVSGFYSAFRKKTGTTPGKFCEFDV